MHTDEGDARPDHFDPSQISISLCDGDEAGMPGQSSEDGPRFFCSFQCLAEK